MPTAPQEQPAQEHAEQRDQEADARRHRRTGAGDQVDVQPERQGGEEHHQARERRDRAGAVERGEQRDRRHDHGRGRSVEPELAPGRERERDGGVQRPEQQVRPHAAHEAGTRTARTLPHEQQTGGREDAQVAERRRAERRHGQLHEQEAPRHQGGDEEQQG